MDNDIIELKLSFHYPLKNCDYLSFDKEHLVLEHLPFLDIIRRQEEEVPEVEQTQREVL